uniref:Glycosyltransferase RgtA/B/C/D-like domain-containing protein n=1 Tax=Eiseniibacteriota bacterium TaxID=2212470 RepID=A0A832I5V6_UNCEI
MDAHRGTPAAPPRAGLGAGLPRAARFALVAAPAVLVALAATLAVRARLAGVVRAEPGVPLWDEAAQGFAGLRVALALRHGQALDLLAALNEQVVWPPLHALLLAPAFLLFGPAFETPARATTWLFAAMALGAFAAAAFAARPGAPPAGAPAPGDARRLLLPLAAASATLAATLLSPAARAFGTLGMLEVPGAALALAAYCAAALEGDPARARRRGALAGALAAALFLLKYNYGLLWLAPLAAVEWSRLPAPYRAAWRARAAAWIARGAWRRPLPLVFLAWGALIASIAATGGWAVEAFGVRVSMRSWGNPAYGLLLAAVAAALVSWARRRAAWRAAWRELPPRTRALAAWAGLPILAWLLAPYPNRVKALAGFVANRATDPAPLSLDGLLYYPRAFAEHYAPEPALGGAALVLALVPPRRGAPAAARLAWWALITGLAATWLHRYHDPRFFFTVAPFVWINAARALTGAVEAALRRAPPSPALATRGALAYGLAALAGLAAPPAPSAPLAALAARVETRARALHRAYRAPDAVVPILDDVLGHTVRAAPARGPTVLLGYSNALSPGLLSWRLAQHTSAARLPLEDLPRRPPALAEGASEDALGARLVDLRDPPRRIVAALPFPHAAGYAAVRAELWADSVTAERLAEDPQMRVAYDSKSACGAYRFRVFEPR